MSRDQAPTEVSERALFASGQHDVVPAFGEHVAPAADISRRNPKEPSRKRAFVPARLPSLAPLRAKAARALTTAFATELDRGTPFLFIPALLAFGAITYYGLPDEPGFQPLIGGALVAGIAGYLLPAHRQLLRLVVLAALVCLLGMLAARVETWRAGTSMLGSEISTRLTGRVAEIDHMANGRVRLTIDVVATARAKLRYTPERVRLSARKIPPGLVVGSEIEGAVRLMSPTGPVRPGSYDFSFSSYFAGIGASGFFLRGPDLVGDASELSVRARLANGVENLRNAIADRIRGHIGGPEGEIAAALVVGIRAGIPENINEAMRRTGIYHIISISGLHMALVAGTMMGSLRAVFALFPGFASRHPVKKYAAAIALVAIAAYLFISGGDVAAQRSFFMLAIMLAALLFDRGALTTRNLAISALIIIAVSPHEVVGPSFQMSFAATAALVGAYALWSERRHSRKRAPPKAGRPLAGVILGKASGAIGAMIVTSLVAGVATTAFGVYHFQRVSPLSLVANLAVMPSVSILVMPFAVAGSLAMPLGLDAPFFYVMGKGLTIMIAVSQWISDRSPIDGVGLISLHSLALLTVALVIVTMATTWLRLLAIPFALAGVLTLTDVRTPDILVSEDGRLVGVPVDSGRLAVNRARPNAFTIENWKRALRTDEVVGPIDSIRDGARARAAAWTTASPDTSEAAFDHDADLPEGPTSAGAIQEDAVENSSEMAGAGFDCHDGLCIAIHRSGAIVVHARDAKIARQACDYASLIVVEDATAKNVCPTEPPMIITRRELAKYGSAAIYLPGAGSGKAGEVEFALEEPYRPWHTQRQFSREARGLPPYQYKTSPPGKQPPRNKHRRANPQDRQPD